RGGESGDRRTVGLRRVGERLAHEIALRGEVVRRGRERDAGFLCNRAVRDSARALPADKVQRGVENRTPATFTPRTSGLAQCPRAAFSPMTPPMIKTRLASFSVEIGSPS